MISLEKETAAVTCWVCEGRSVTLVRPATVQKIASESFAITDSHYGSTLAIYRCADCGFLQCSKAGDVLGYYEDLEDPSYEEGRAERSLQAQRIVAALAAHQPKGRLLDIGAGTGILVEQALKAGYDATGIEPSRWLQSKAKEHRLPVLLGSFPHPDITGKFDVITLVDVIEHVLDPVGLLRSIAGALSPGGIAVIITPDVRSVAARLLGFRWWHYRVAHVGYFGKETLRLACRKAGLQIAVFTRPAWFFASSYLAQRVLSYVPAFLRPPVPRLLDRFVVRLDLRDSLMAIARHPDA